MVLLTVSEIMGGLSHPSLDVHLPKRKMEGMGAVSMCTDLQQRQAFFVESTIGSED
jgi:hypothetical protein